MRLPRTVRLEWVVLARLAVPARVPYAISTRQITTCAFSTRCAFRTIGFVRVTAVRSTIIQCCAFCLRHATAGAQGQRYDTLRGLAPRATTPNLPPPIRVEQMPDPAPTLPLTIDDLLTSSTSSAAGRPTTTTSSSSSAAARAHASKPTQHPKPNPTPTPIVPQISVRAMAVRAK